MRLIDLLFARCLYGLLIFVGPIITMTTLSPVQHTKMLAIGCILIEKNESVARLYCSEVFNENV
jgi:hypothetical protein